MEKNRRSDQRESHQFSMKIDHGFTPTMKVRVCTSIDNLSLLTLISIHGERRGMVRSACRSVN